MVTPGPLRDPLGITRSGKIEAHRHDVRCRKPRIHMKEAHEASDEKTGAEDQYHRERDLSYQECASKPAARNPDCRSQRAPKVHARPGECGKNAEDEGRGDGERE